jgi:hypothetical protein
MHDEDVARFFFPHPTFFFSSLATMTMIPSPSPPPDRRCDDLAAAPRRAVRSRSDSPPDDAPISRPCRRFDDFPRPKRAFPPDGDEKSVSKLTKPGFRVLIERGTGSALHFSDADYEAAGAKVADADDVWRDSDIVMKVRALVASRRVVAGRRDGGGAMRSDDGKLATRRRLTHSLPARHTFAMCPAPTCDLGMKRTRGSGPRPPAPSLLGGGIVHGLVEDCGILLSGWLPGRSGLNRVSLLSLYFFCASCCVVCSVVGTYAPEDLM